MQEVLQTYITEYLFSFILVFTRVGSAIMIMPGIGDSFVSSNVRLHFAVAMSIVVAPILTLYLPPIPTSSVGFVALIVTEAVIGLFIGTIMRIMMSSLETAGVIISMQSGFANANIFNPVAGGQGSLIGAFLSMLGVVFIFVTNMHHFLIATIFESYKLFPTDFNLIDNAGDLSDAIATTVNTAFVTGVKLSAPFMAMGLLMYLGFGVLGRLLPQIQVFFLALPVQILISLITLSLVFSTIVLFWIEEFGEIIMQMLAP